MSLRKRLFLAFVFSMIAGFGLLLWLIKEPIRRSHALVAEDFAVDTAELLAQFVDYDKDGQIHLDRFVRAFQEYKAKKIQAQILTTMKTTPALDVYITNKDGIVLFSSGQPSDVGRDFSQWRDVYLTLRGNYGVRSTKSDLNNEDSSVYHIGAPLKYNGKIVGVLTVAKTRASFMKLINAALEKILPFTVYTVLVLAFFTLIIIYQITGPLNQIREYTLEAAKGLRPILPAIASRELSQLANAIKHMKDSLEAKAQTESFVTSFVHELKSPLTAINASAELLNESLPEEKRRKFATNIKEESKRMSKILEKILGLAQLESQQKLKEYQACELKKISQAAISDLAAQAQLRNIQIKFEGEERVISGDEFLIYHAIRNLLENAIDFSDQGGRVVVQIDVVENQVRVSVIDDGPGIPDYAKGRLFEKFFSTPRESTGKRGTGLGLSFVREIVHLHHGQIILRSPAPGSMRGTRAELVFPDNEFSSTDRTYETFLS